VLTVIEDAAIPSDIWRTADGDIEIVRREMRRRAEAIGSHAVARLSAAGLLAEALIHIGDPRVEIINAAKDWQADFAFVRSHIFNSVTRWLLGSVSKFVLREAPCSVEIVRAPEHETKPAEKGIKILLATDGSDSARAAASSVALRPWPINSEVKIISAADPFGFIVEEEIKSAEEFDRLREPTLTREEKAVLLTKEIVDAAGLKTSWAVVGGHPKAAIVDEAKEWGADLVVVGSHGQRGLKRILLGSVSESVALHAHCSVEVIRTKRLDRD
jgi:nucleotide-binding universal stress UspA family protein